MFFERIGEVVVDDNFIVVQNNVADTSFTPFSFNVCLWIVIS